MGRKVTCEMLGDESRRKKKRGNEEFPHPLEDGPKLLPLSYFSDCETAEQRIDLCQAAFEDLLQTHDPIATGKGVVLMVRFLLTEINHVFEGDDASKMEIVQRFKRHRWFNENNQHIKWRAGAGSL